MIRSREVNRWWCLPESDLTARIPWADEGGVFFWDDLIFSYWSIGIIRSGVWKDHEIEERQRTISWWSTSTVCAKWHFLLWLVNSSDWESEWERGLMRKCVWKIYEQSLKDIRESNDGDRLHFDLGFNGVDWWRVSQFSRIPLEILLADWRIKGKFSWREFQENHRIDPIEIYFIIEQTSLFNQIHPIQLISNPKID